MRRTISALMLLGVIGGCSGGDDGAGGAPAGDTQAPSVALSAAATVEGGDTTAITVTVTDNVDTGLAYMLSCNGGTLTGNLLATTAVTADTPIKCTATATDKAGNTGTGSVTITVKPATSSLTVSSGSAQVSAGGMGLLLADNVALDQPSYQGSFNGHAVTLLRSSGNELLYVMPIDVPAGSGRLTVEIGGHSYGMDVAVTAPITVANPREAVRSAFVDAKGAVNDALATGTITATDRTTLQAQLPRIDQAIAALADVSDGDIAKLASIFAANGLIASQSAADYTPIKLGENCGAQAKAFARNLVYAAAGAALIAGAIDVSITVGAAAPALVIPDIIFSGIGIAGGAYLTVTYGRKTVQSIKPFFTACWTETSIDLIPDELFQTGGKHVQAITVAAKPAFRQKEPRSFHIQRSFTPGAQIRAEVNRYAADIAGLLATVSFLPADVRTGLAEFKTQGTEIVPAANLSLSGITRGDITGSLGGSGDTITLTFRFKDPVPTTDANVDFGFTLNRAQEEAVNVNAQLSIALPEADDAAIEVTQGKPASSSVQTRGADSLEVVTQPAHGTVSLQNSGAFTYTPSGQYFGPDQFKYRARNTDGVSENATVAISVVRRFEGVWNVTSRATTTSETSQGLCPNEVNTFSVNVTKSSDTLYMTSYEGVPITLTMASKDDPAGLHGSASATYDDGPGETSESVSVSMPDSTHLSGSGSFHYHGPGGSACSGTTSITGGRP